MELSANGRSLLQNQESYRQFPYDDRTKKRLFFGEKPRGHATIGFGHVMSSLEMLDKMLFLYGWDRARAELVFSMQLRHYENCVWKHLRAEVNQNQFDAMVIFAYNIGIDEQKGFPSTSVLRHVNAKRFREAADSFKLWHTGNGIPHLLDNRRRAEANLFKTPMPK